MMEELLRLLIRLLPPSPTFDALSWRVLVSTTLGSLYWYMLYRDGWAYWVVVLSAFLFAVDLLRCLWAMGELFHSYWTKTVSGDTADSTDSLDYGETGEPDDEPEEPDDRPFYAGIFTRQALVDVVLCLLPLVLVGWD